MAIKTFNTRIQNKYDEYRDWVANDPVLLSGEICTVVIPAETGAVQQEPTVLMKVGDGSSKWSALPWLGAVSCDIYNWAKQPTKPEYQASEIKNLADFISGEIQDTNTTYKLEQDASDNHIIKLYSKELNGSWTLIASITTADTVYDDTAILGRVSSLETKVGNDTVANQIDAKIVALKLSETYDAKGAADAVDAKLTAEVARAQAAEEANAAAAKAADDKAVAAQDDVDALSEKVGEVPADKTIIQMISEAQTAATYDDTQVKADIKANADAIDVLNGSGEGSVDKKITDAFNDFSTKVTDDAVVNSYKELIDWAAEHGSDAAEMTAAITTLQNILVGIGGEGESATVVAYVNSAIEALKIGDYAKATELAALAERVAAMEAKVSNWDAAEQNAKEHANDLNEAMDARMQVVEGKAHEHTFNEAELNKIVEGDVAKWNAAQANAEATAAAALSDAKTELNAEIAKKANSADLHAIATSGNVDDLEQTENTYFIINCGTASTLI